MAVAKGITTYLRVPALGIQDEFIRCLAEIIKLKLDNFSNQLSINSSTGSRICPNFFKKCRVNEK